MIGYGSNIELSPLSIGEVGKIIEHKNNHGLGFWGVFKIILDIVEVGLSFIPGAGWIAQTAIAAGASAIRLGIDAGQGQINPLSAGLDVGSAFIPGITHGIGKFFGKGVGEVSGEFGDLFENPIMKGVKSPEEFEVAANKFWDRVNEAGEDFLHNPTSNSNVVSYDNWDGVQVSQKFYDEFVKPNETFHNVERGLFEDMANNDLGSLAEAFASNPELKISDFDFEKMFDGRVIQGIGETGEEIGEETYTINKKLALELLDELGMTELELKDFKKAIEMGYTRRQLWEALVNRFGKRRIAKFHAKTKFWNLFPKTNAVEEEVMFAEVIGKEVKRKGLINRLIHAVKRPSSAEFNDVVVQNVQAIFDANDLGRMPIEKAYQTLKNALRKQFKKLNKLINNGEKIDKIFEKSGGKLVNSNVIVGYKILKTIKFHHTILISFYPEATKANRAFYRGRRTNNIGGKRPVMVNATSLQLKRLREEGMRYYLNKWALSRGGKPTGYGLFRGFNFVSKIAGEATVLLPFINTGLLRNMLSLSSNIVGNVTKMVEGTWASTWVEKFSGSFSRSWKNRLGRLFGRVVGGEVAGLFFGKRIGAMVGKELQRFNSMITTSYIKASSMKKGSFLDNFGRTFTKQINTRVATSIRGHVKAHARRTGRANVILGSMGANRKLGFLARIPSSGTGGAWSRKKLAIKLK